MKIFLIVFLLNVGNFFNAIARNSDSGNYLTITRSSGRSAGVTGGFAIASWVKISGSGNGNASVTTSGDHIQIADFDGDGIPDLLKSTGSGNLEVRYAHLGKTGLLKAVTTPLGGSITMDYAMTQANVHHSRRWVMTKVMTNDSLPGDGCDGTLTCIRYNHGHYDRAEREFLGFAVVVVNDVDGNNDTLRTTIRYYDNRSFYAKGSLLCEALVKINENNGIRDTAKYVVTTCGYDTIHIPFVVGGNTYRSVFPKLVRRQTCFFEGLPQAQITAWEEFDYENTHGNVVRQRQGSTSQLTVEANISYHAQYNGNHCVNRVSSVEIPGYKKRTTEVDNKGHYTAFRDWYSSTQNLATRLQYDYYGNVTTMRGPNTTVHYTYDNFVHSYPTEITDTFGVSSYMQDYDFRFGIPTTVIDRTYTPMFHTLDGWGRTVTIQGPKEYAAHVPYTIRYTYTGREPAPAGTTRQRAVSMAMTEHYDQQHSSNFIRTYTYCDGLGRIVQTRKEAAVNGVEKLVISGHTVVDALGRTVETYYPTEIHKDSTRFRFIIDQSAPASTVTYDILDRPLVQTAPDASTTTFQYGFDNSHQNEMLFSTTTTDANSHPSIELKDVSGKPWVVHPSGQQPVCFNYNLVGDNTKVYSSVANDWERNYTYDWLGRRLTYTEGELAEYLTYDGSNLATHTQRWLENGQPRTKTTQFHYNAHRLDSVGYDDALTTIYHYDQYGRVDSLYDESGVMCYEYGSMGEVTKETRIYAMPFLAQPIALGTQFGYDSWGRVDSIIYPDNEIVKYQYDCGGQLQRIYNRQVPAYIYLDSVLYDRFGAKTSQKYGNGIKTLYSYNNDTRRLENIITNNGASTISSFTYTYDNVGNVTQVTSSCPWLQNQNFSETFTYDASDQLISASETNSSSYQLTVSYGNWGKITCYSLAQADLQNNTTQSEIQSYTYPAANSLQNSQTLFAPVSRTIQGGQHPHSVQTFTFGINGSLRKIETHAWNHNVEYYLFNSAANLKAYSNNGLDFAYYGYNAANTRSYKLSMLNQNQWINGQPEPIHLQLQSAMFYPNAYINFNQNGEYTKHYYNGSERIASRLGENTVPISTNNNDRLGYRIMQADEQARADLLEVVEAGDVPIETPSVDVTTLQVSGNPDDIFYYHTNHLGSTAFITDNNTNIHQGFLYAPFGEITTEYDINFGYNVLPKYSFNAKELDEETGMYYYEARYYKPPVFTSRDPMFEKYFWMTPYAYCANNPVKYVDPSGMHFDPVVDEENKTITIKATYCTTEADKDKLKEAIDIWNNQSGKYTYTVGEGENAKEYIVNFELTMEVFKDKDAMNSAAKNGDNFYYGDELDGRCNSCRAACEDGYLMYGNSETPIRSIGHEIGHTLGIDDHSSNAGIMLSGGNSSVILSKHIVTILDVAGIECTNNVYRLYKIDCVKVTQKFSMKGVLNRRDTNVP